ncbi:MAG: oxidoreductase [Desulfobacteraceae bacterium]|nr:MAG: oxidoreductase [Desulfobacteraceae bacterium]
MNPETDKIPAIAVIGSGYWGKNLVRVFHTLHALKLICDKNEDTLIRFKESYPEIEICQSLSELLIRDDIDGVVIAAPAETHYDIAREVLLSGKHVYVEKPLTLREEDGEELIRIAKNQNKTLMVGHLLQYHPAFCRLKELARNGELGKINYIYSNRLNLGKIRREENILWSFAPHDISMILSLAGEFPEAVYATGGNYLHKKIADVTTTHLDFSSGLKAHIFVSWLHPFKEQKLVVVGDKKMAVFDDTQPWEKKLLLYPHKINWKNNIPVPDKADAEKIELPESEPLKLECEHFLQSILLKFRPITDGEEGLRVLKVLNACQRSLDSGNCKIVLKGNENKDVQIHSSENKKQQSTDYFHHETAVIDEGAEIGPKTKIWHFSHILKGAKIGAGCNLGQNVSVSGGVTLGNNVKVQNNVSIYEGSIVEDDVFLGPSCVLTNVTNPRSQITRRSLYETTLIRRGATIGANATIVCGVTIGRYAFVAAGTTVTRDVPDYGLVMGSPGRLHGWMSRHGHRLTSSGNGPMICPESGLRYQEIEPGVLRCLDVDEEEPLPSSMSVGVNSYDYFKS